MADSAIYDLTQESALNAADRVLLQQTSAATRATSATVALMGGLVYSAASVTTANATGVVGTLHGLDVSGMTADRSFVLPDTAQVGERVGVYITAGLVSGTLYELDLVTAASGSMINGADASSTPWSRLFITNETVIFRCIKAGGAGDTDWIVEHDGRIACVAFLYRGSDSSAIMTANTFVHVTFTAIVSGQEVGGISVLASNYVQPRRAGIYRVDGMVRMTGAASGIAIAQIRDPQATPTYSFRGPNTGANGGSTLDGSVGGYFPVTHANLAATAGRISMYALHNSGSSTLPIGGVASPNYLTRLVVREEFR